MIPFDTVALCTRIAKHHSGYGILDFRYIRVTGDTGKG